MKRKKILIYIHQGILKGGVEKVFSNLINNIPMDKYQITVLSVMGYLTDDFQTQIYPPQVKRYCQMWDEFSKNPITRIAQKIHNRIFPTIVKVVLRFKRYDVAIAAQEGIYAKFVIDNVNAKKKYLWIHNDIEQCHWTEAVFGSTSKEREYYERFDNVVCVSKGVADSMNNTFGNLKNLTVCNNPIDTNEIDLKIKEPLPTRPDGMWFVCIGRLANQKGFDRLIKVCKRLNDEGYKFKVSVLGEGEDRHILEKMIDEYQVKNIELLGNKINPFNYLSAANWFLLPSRHEGFGMVLHEAIYCETPIITTDVCGAKELLGNSEYGIICENSESGIYESMKNVMDDPNLSQHYKKMAKCRKPFVSLTERIRTILKVID